MQMKEDLVKIMAAYSKEVDTEFNVYKCVIEDDWNTVAEHILTLLQSNDAGQTNGSKPDVSGWVAVEDSLPDTLETVWISNGKGWTTLGCRTDLYDDGEGGFAWCWAAVVGGIIYEEDGSIVVECEEDDYDVRFWHKLPKPPCR